MLNEAQPTDGGINQNVQGCTCFHSIRDSYNNIFRKPNIIIQNKVEEVVASVVAA